MASSLEARILLNIVLELIIFFPFITPVHVVRGIDCFKCVSINGDNPACEDPFHNNYSSNILQSPCWAGRKDRNGVFPASACVKLNGIYSDTGVRMVVRDCALDSGTLTTDTELVRMSHCGGFYFDKRYVNGCVQSCFEDACNGSSSLMMSWGNKVSRLLHMALFIGISSCWWMNRFRFPFPF